MIQIPRHVYVNGIRKRNPILYHRGIRLNGAQFPCGEMRFRTRYKGRLSYTLLRALDREWLDAYVQLYLHLGRPEVARRLRLDWLAAKKAG